MKINRHSYYKELDENDQLMLDRVWLKKALKCTLEEHAGWTVSEDSLERLLNDKNFTKKDYLDFISMKNELIAEKLRNFEEVL